MRHARASAHDLDRALNRACGSATALVRDLTSTSALDRTCRVALEFTWSLADARNAASEFVWSLARIRDLASTSALASARDLAREVERNRVLFGGLVRALDDARAVNGAFALASELDRALISANGFASDLISAAQGAFRTGETSEQRPAPRVAAPAKGLVAAASRLLPAADRHRYYEEYRSELWDLAASNRGRTQQIRYAARQLCRAVPLRYATLAPRRKRAPL